MDNITTINLGACPLQYLSIGYVGETGAREQVFDFSAWAAEYGSGVLQLLLQRPGDAEPYPVLLDIDGTTAVWTPDDTDTEKAGQGQAQLVYTVGGVVVKNAIFRVLIAPSLGAPGDPPEPYETWLERLTALAAETQQSALDAAESAEDAEQSAEDAAVAKTDAETAATNAGTSAATAAEKAAQAAQSAQTAVENADYSETQRIAAENAAVSAADSAENAAQSAETAAQYGSAAEQSAEDAQSAAAAAAAAVTEVETKGAQQITAIETAGAAQVQALAEAAAEQEQAIEAAGTEQITAVGDAGAAQVQAVEDKGEEVLERIPEDYSELSADVVDLKSSLLLHDELIDDTIQTMTIDSSGNVSQIVHTRDNVAIRTDAFSYGTGTITEVRTLSTGESLTIATDTTTRVTTVTYADAV